MADWPNYIDPDAALAQMFTTPPQPGPLEAMRQAYPWTAGLDVNVIDSTAKGDPTRQLEFYPAGSEDNPQQAMRSKPTVEIFNKDIKPADMMGELLSHYLPAVDPQVADFRRQILASMTPEQINELQGDYERDQRAGLLDKGETIEQWAAKQGGDAFFRGYPTGQWPEQVYLPNQIGIYDQLNQYLKAKYGGPTGPADRLFVPGYGDVDVHSITEPLGPGIPGSPIRMLEQQTHWGDPFDPGIYGHAAPPGDALYHVPLDPIAPRVMPGVPPDEGWSRMMGILGKSSKHDPLYVPLASPTDQLYSNEPFDFSKAIEESDKAASKDTK